MSLLKKIAYFSLCFVLKNSYGYICVNSTSNYKMFGSVLRSNVLKNPFLMAFHDEKFVDYKIFHAEDDAELIDQIQLMAKSECSVVLGLFTSQDCLVSGSILKKNKTIGLSSSCSDNHIQKYYPYIYTAVPRLSDFSRSAADYINGHNADEVYVFYQPSDVYSNYAVEAFYHYLKKKVISIPVSSSGVFDVKKLSPIIKKNTTMIFFTYPLPSAQILVEIDSHNQINSNVNVIGASSWIFDVSVFRPIERTLAKANSVISPSLLKASNPNKSRFSQVFIKRYQRPPDLVEILTYDISRLAVRCYKRSHKTSLFKAEQFLRCIKSGQYTGVSGKMKFKDGTAFSDRDIFMINFMDSIK